MYLRSWIQRFVLPGLAFKAVVIGGGYATGRELVEFFMPSGPRGGLLGMALALVAWSAICTLTFLFARMTGSYDYRSFFKQLLGHGWIAFEICNVVFSILVLSVFGAAAGAIGGALFGWPTIAGTLCLTAGIVLIAALGSRAVEQMFGYVSVLLYAVYALFLILASLAFGDRIIGAFSMPVPVAGWWQGGITYSGYNIVGAILILPVLRHLTSNRDAIVAGLLCGPLAMIPAMIFFVCMMAYYPQIGAEPLPSNYLLEKLDLPAFQFLFQLMIFAALLECSTGTVHAINERIVATLPEARSASPGLRIIVSAALLIVAVFVAERIGLVELIGKGYAVLSWAFIGIYVVPLLTYGAYRLWQQDR